jgi:hypothetical protein
MSPQFTCSSDLLEGQLGVMAAAQLVALLAQDRLPPEIIDPKYPVALVEMAESMAIGRYGADLRRRSPTVQAFVPSIVLPSGL